MKKVSNGYSRVKINGVYANNIPTLTRIILNGFTYLLEKEQITTGEPYIIANKKLYGFLTSYSALFYSEKDDKIVVQFDTSLWDQQQKKEKEYVTKTYDNINEELIKDLKYFVKSKNKDTSLEYYIRSIESYKKYKEDWNSYHCNEVSIISIEKAKYFITHLYPLINLSDVSLKVYPIADGGNISKSPPEGSKSTVGIRLQNGDRELEFEIEHENGTSIIPIAMENVYNEHYESKLHFPYFADDEYVISEDLVNDIFLKQALPWIHYEDPIA